MINKMELRAALQSSLVACIMLSSVSSAQAQDEVPTALSSNTYVSKLGERCSVPPPGLEIDTDGNITNQALFSGIGTAILAPILSNTISGGLDAIGSALTEAANEDKNGKTLMTASGSGNLAEIDLKSDSYVPPTTKHRHFCVRVLVANVTQAQSRGPQESQALLDDSGTHQAVAPDGQDISISDESWKPSNSKKFKQMIAKTLKESNDLDLNIHETYFYAEYLVGAVKNSPMSGKVYKIRPVLLWYPESIHGSRYKLASATLDFQPVPTTVEKKPIMQYSQVFGPDALRRGTYLDARAGTLGSSGWLAVNPIDSESQKAISTIGSLITTHKTAKTTYDELATAPGLTDAERNKRQAALNTIEYAKTECDMKANGETNARQKQNVLNLCQLAYENSIFLKTQVDHLLLDETSAKTLATAKKAMDDADAAIQEAKDSYNLRNRVGPFNVSVSLKETRNPNKFYKLLGEAITSSKDVRDPKVQEYINSQLGITPDPEDTATEPDLIAETGGYMLAKQAYDNALRDYGKAVDVGNQDMIDESLTTLIEAYTALRTKAKAAEIEVNVPAPY